MKIGCVGKQMFDSVAQNWVSPRVRDLKGLVPSHFTDPSGMLSDCLKNESPMGNGTKWLLCFS